MQKENSSITKAKHSHLQDLYLRWLLLITLYLNTLLSGCQTIFVVLSFISLQALSCSLSLKSGLHIFYFLNFFVNELES